MCNFNKHFLTYLEFFKFVYYFIKNKLGKFTFGTMSETLDGIFNEWFQEAVEDIFEGIYFSKLPAYNYF